MKNNSIFKHIIVFLVIWIIIAIPSYIQFSLQINEENTIESYLAKYGFSDKPISHATAVNISQHIRNEFNVDRSSFRNLKLSGKPFLREDAKSLLTHKEGLCGEGTRVIISILIKMGFDATRVVLYNRNLHSSHTLISVLIDGDEHFVDSINTSKETNDFLNNNQVSSSDFPVIGYTGDVLERKRLAKTAKSSDRDWGEYSAIANKFFDRFWLYSYDAMPFSKILSKLGFNIRAFNFDRPHIFVSALAEKPHLTMAVIYLAGSFFITLLIYYFYHKFALSIVTTKSYS